MKYHEKLAYTMPNGRLVITKFDDLGDQTKVATEFDTENQNFLDMQRDGW